MAHVVFDWVTRRFVQFVVGNVAGELIVASDPLDVGDWEEVQVQLSSLANGGTAANIQFNLQTAITNDDHSFWEAVWATNIAVPTTPDGFLIFKLNPANLVTGIQAQGLRKWLRIVAIHTGGAPVITDTITFHAVILFKKRTP